MLDDELTSVQGELDKVNERISQLNQEAEQVKKNDAEVKTKTDLQEEEIKKLNLQIEALNTKNTTGKADESVLKETRAVLTDSRNKDLKACCDKQKTFDKVKSLINNRFSSNADVQGIMNSIFMLCYGPTAKYDGNARIMATIDDFNTGIRGATCSLDKDAVKAIMEKIRYSEEVNKSGRYYQALIADSGDKDLIFIVPFYKLLSRMCHLQMHMFKFNRNQQKQQENDKQIKHYEVQIETCQAVIDALSFHHDLQEESEHLAKTEVESIKKKQERLNTRVSEIQNTKYYFDQKFFNDL